MGNKYDCTADDHMRNLGIIYHPPCLPQNKLSLENAMKLRRLFAARLSFPLASALAVLLSAPAAHAANLYWDIDGAAAGAGGATPSGAWTTGGTTWSTSSIGTAAAAGSTTLAADDLFFSAGTNATGAYTIGLTSTQNAGSLTFEEGAATISGAGGIITLGGTGGRITVGSGLTATIGATTNTIVGGTVGLTKLGNGTLTLNGSLANTYTGTTTINAGSISLSGGGSINTSTGLTLNGGGLTLTNGSAEAALDRVSGAAVISNGGTLTYANTATASTTFVEAIGSVALASGQLNLVQSMDQNAALNSQTLTLGGLTQTGTAAVTFSALTTAPNATTNIVAVSGASTTPAGQIIGPWATTGVAAGSQNLYATYNAFGQIVPMPVADTAETTWTNAANSYSGIGAVTLTGTRTVNALRYYGAASTFTLGNSNLQTYGLLFGGNNVMTVTNAGTGVLTTPSGGGSLYITSGFTAPAHVISAPITDNGGVVTVVKSGAGSLTLSSPFNSFTGGVVINGGTLVANANINLGGAAGGITVNGSANLTIGSVTYPRTLTINNGAIVTNGNSNPTITGAVTGTGGVAVSSGFGSQLVLSSASNTFEGPILVGVVSGTTTQAYRVSVGSIADSATANGSIEFLASSISHANGSAFEYTGAVNQTIANRQFRILSTGATPVNGHQIRNLGTGNLTISTDLDVRSAAAQNLRLAGTNAGSVFSGVISNGSSTAVSLTKVDAGNWGLSGANTYTGPTRIAGGTLTVNSLANGGSPSSIGQSSTAALNLVLAGGILQYAPISAVGGGGHTSDRNLILTASSTISASGTGALVFGQTGGISPDVTGLTGTRTAGSAVITALGSTANLVVGMGIAGTGIPTGRTIASIDSATQVTMNSGTSVTASTSAVSFGYIARTLTLAGTSTDANTIAGVLQNSSAVAAGVLTLGKTGLGSWSLSGVNTFSGNITVSAGTLIGAGATNGSGGVSVFGSRVNTRTITVNNGGTLQFNSGNILGSNHTQITAPTLVINSGGVVTNGGIATNNALNNVQLNGGTLTSTTGHTSSSAPFDPVYGAWNLNGSVTSTGNSTISTSDPTKGWIMLKVVGDKTTDFSVTSGTLTVSAPVVDNLVDSNIGSLRKSGAGSMVLSAANTYSGATSVTGGFLTVSGGGTLASTSGLSVSGGAAFNYQPTTIGTALTLGAASTLGLSDGSSIGLTWDATTASNIVALGAATVGTAGVGLNMTGSYNSAILYTVLTAASGLDTGAYYLSNPVDYTAVIVKSPTSVTITPTAAPPIAGAYWIGTATAGLTKVWAASDGIADSNWATSAGGAAQALVPGAGADVIVSATTPVVAPTTTTLGANMSIKTLTISDTVNGLSLSDAANTLTITPGAPTVGITMDASVPASTIGTKVALGANQTWTNNSASPLTVGGVISGAFGLTKAGTGTVVSSAFNTFSGPLTIDGGTLEFSASATGANNVYASTQININGASTLRISGGSGNIPIYENRNYTFDATGGGSILVGTGNYNAGTAGFTVTTLGGAANTIGLITTSGAFGFNIGTGSGVTFDVATGSDITSDLTVAPTIANTGAVTKNGAGRLTFTGTNNTYSGGTFINAGTLRLSGGTAITGVVTLADAAGATLQVVTSEGLAALTGGGATGGAVSIDTAQVLTLVGAANSIQTYAGTIGGGGALTNAGTNATSFQTLSGVLSHGAGINVTSGTLTLTNSGNSYTGVTLIDGPATGNTASLIVTADGALGATGPGNGTTVSGEGVNVVAASLGLSGGINYATAETITGSGAGQNARGFIQSVSGSNTFAGNIELGVNGESRIGSQDGASLTLTGAITQASGITTGSILFRVGSIAGDFVTLSNAGSSFGGDSTIFTGATNGYAGVRLGISDGLPTGLTVSGFSGTNAANTALDLAGFNQKLNGLISGAGALQVINTNTGTPSTLTLDPLTADRTTTNTLILGGGALGVINVVKNGTFGQTLGGIHTYTGDTTVNAGTLTLADNAQLKFVLGSSTGINNTLTGPGTANLDGDFNIDTSAADSLASGSWTLESAGGGSYGATFSVVGFTNAGGDKWTKANGATKMYRFDEATGILTLGPVDYAFWISSFFPGVTNPLIIGSGADPDFDGIANSVEMVIGGNPATGMDTALLPTIELVNADPDGDTTFSDYLLFTYRRSDLSAAALVTADCETDTDLVAPWTAATGAPGVVILVNDNFAFSPPAAADTDRVRVYVPRGSNTTLFGRLNVVVP